MMTNPLRSIRIHLLLVALCATQVFAQTRRPELPNPGNAPISREQQVQLGFQAAAEVYKQMPLLPDNSPETRYIRQIGQRLVATIPQEYSWPFEFHTVAQKEINAFALPGGPMFVNVGTITAAANEAELAGVMAHEMAHVYMQHSAKQMGKAQLTQGVAGLLGAILGAKGGTLGSLAQMGIQFGAAGLMLKYSRTDESQADAVGAIILYKAGYNPQALANFFETLAGEGGSRGPQFLSDHPNPGNREQAIHNEIRNWPSQKYRTDNSAFNKVRKQAASVKVYTAEEIAQGAKTGQWASMNKKNGVVIQQPAGTSGEPANQGPVSLNQVLPSSRMVSADLGPMNVVRPENWDLIMPQQQGASVTIAPKAGLAGQGIGYGVVINGASPANGQSANLDQMTAEIVKSIQGGGNDVQTVGNTKSISVAGVRGRSVTMQSTSPFPNSKGQSQKERDWLVTVPRPDGSVFYFVFVAPEAEFDQFQPTFEDMLSSVRFSQ